MQRHLGSLDSRSSKMRAPSLQSQRNNRLPFLGDSAAIVKSENSPLILNARPPRHAQAAMTSGVRKKRLQVLINYSASRPCSANVVFTWRIRYSMCRMSALPPPALSCKSRQSVVSYSHRKIIGFPIRLRPGLGHNNRRRKTKVESKPWPSDFRKPDAKGNSACQQITINR